MGATTAILLTIGSQLSAQSGSLAGTIMSRETGERLGYAVVDVEGQGRAQFANDSGAFSWAISRQQSLRFV